MKEERREMAIVRVCVSCQGNTDLNALKGNFACFDLTGSKGA